MVGKAEVGISLYTYGADLRAKRMTVKECIEHAASLGVEGVELVDKQHIPNYPHQSVYDLQEIRDYIKSCGMKVSCYSTYIDSAIRSDRLATPEEEFRQIVEDIAEAKVLGARVYRPAYMPFEIDGREAPLDRAKGAEALTRQMKKVISQALPVLKKSDIIWGAEIHAPIPPEFFITLAKEINDESFGLVPDFSAWQTKGLPTEYGMSSLELFKEALKYSVHVHAKAHFFDEKGEEPNTPYGKLIPLISNSGFDGFISAEYEGWWMGDQSDSRKNAEIHVKLIRRYL